MKNIWDVNIQVGDNILDVIKYREDRSKAKANFDRVLNGESFTVVEQYGDESINRNWYQSEYSPLYDNSNNVIGLTVFSIDITERKQAEIALKENEEKFRTLFEQNMLSIYLHDVDGNIIDVNTKACSQLGYSLEELLEMSVFDFIYTKDVGGYFSKQELLSLWNQMKLGERTTVEDMHQHQNGSVMYVEVSTGLVKYTNREMIMALVQDITKRKQEENLLNSTFEALEHPFYLIDVNSYQVLKANAATGVKRDEYITCYSLTHNRSEPCSEKEHPCPMEIIKRTKQSTKVEHVHYDEEGNTINVEVHAHPVFNEKGELIQVIEYCLDITARKQAEKYLQESYKELEIKQSQIDEELEKAKQIHEKTLLGKSSEIGSPKNISLEAHYYPAKQIGGDFYNFIRVENKLIIYLSDVTGHGIEAAIISTSVKETIVNYADLETGELTPEKILNHVYKHYINNNFPEDYFVCLYVAVLDLDTYELTYSAAGMQFPPFVKLVDGSCLNLQSEGPPISSVIGLELMDFRADSVNLTPGSIVLFYTDGIAEQMNEDNNPYEERLKNTFYSQQSKFPPELVKQVINNDLINFNGSLQGDDDITYVILQINPPERKQYYWELYSKTQEIENFYSEVFPVISEFVNEETTIKCLYELVVNAMEHGNNFDSNKKVYVHVVLTNDYVFATVEDQGDGFNWKEKMAAKSQDIIDSEKERGRGILMARSLCDRLFYNEKGNKAF